MLPSGTNFDDFFRALMVADRRRARPVPTGGRGPGLNGPTLGGSGGARGGRGARSEVIQEDPARRDPNYAMKQQAERAELNARMEKAAAATAPPPLKLVTIAGQTFYTPDELAMNSFQRDYYSPKNTSFVDPSDEANADRLRRGNNLASWDAYVQGTMDPYGTIAANRGPDRPRVLSGG